MSATAATTTLDRPLRFYEATIGKKVVMAVTGCILFLFVAGHTIGNLQVYIGSEQLNHYAEMLQSLHGMLWVVRGVMLVTVILHIIMAIQLWLINRRARPMNYIRQGWVQASFASRTQIYSGLLVGAFIVYHLLHFTIGHAYLQLQNLPDGNIDVYAHVIQGFQQVAASIVYIVAMICLGFHLSHGVWSMFQSVGINHPRLTPCLQKFAVVIAILIAVATISIPVSVMAGIISR